jgi:integrase
LRVKDAYGRWANIASTAKTKTEAWRLASDLERKAERQRLGVEPLPTDCMLTVGELVSWWLRERCPAASYEREESRLKKNVISTPLGSVLVRHLTAARVEDHLHELEKAGAAPASVNHVRAKLRTVFFKAKKAGLWVGANPIIETEPRRVPKRLHPTLRIEEIPRVLEHVPELWQPFSATAIYAGLRKGELCGLRKCDTDLDAGLITVRCSYDRETTKGGHADVIPIAPALTSFLQTAIDASPSDLVFPWPDGSMRSPECDPEKVLRRALAVSDDDNGHLWSSTVDDLRDAVARIGPKNPVPFAAGLLQKPTRALPAPKHPRDLSSENPAFQSEPRGDRTHDPRLKRPVLYQLS